MSEISRIHPFIPSPSRPEKTPYNSSTPAQGTAAHTIGSSDRDSFMIAQRDILLNRLMDINARYNDLSLGERRLNKELNQIQDLVGRMKVLLETIVKTYPPFPPGSEERIRILKSYSALREMIDQLTIPPPEEYRHRGSVADSARHEGTEKPSTTNGFAKVKEKWQFSHSGISAVDLPELPEDATDAAIHATIDRLQAAEEALRRELGIHEKEAPDINYSKGFMIPGSSDLKDMSEREALHVSIELRGSFGVNHALSITESQFPMEQLL